MRKTIVGLMFHPIYKNTVFVLQEGGDIHAADVQTQEIIVEYIA